MDVSARWAQIMALPEEDIPLDEAALLVSASADPGVDVGHQLTRLDMLAARIEPSDADAVLRFLFVDLELRGNRAHYDDPDNSYIDKVLDRRLGIPISLSVITVEVGRRCGVIFDPVGMPGHFLLREPSSPDELIDVFDGGRRLSHSDCENLLRSISGLAVPLTPAMLASTGKRAILNRMLANLDRSFVSVGDRRNLEWVTALRLAVPGAPPADRAHLAERLAGLGRFDVAAEVLEEAAAQADQEEARERLNQQAISLRARLN